MHAFLRWAESQELKPGREPQQVLQPPASLRCARLVPAQGLPTRVSCGGAFHVNELCRQRFPQDDEDLLRGCSVLSPLVHARRCFREAAECGKLRASDLSGGLSARRNSLRKGVSLSFLRERLFHQRRRIFDY